MDWINQEVSVVQNDKFGVFNFKTRRCPFIPKCKIKLFKSLLNFHIVIDSFNLIYILSEKFELLKTFKITFYKVTDFIEYNGSILLCSETSSRFYLISIGGKGEEIPEFKLSVVNKDYGKVRKMIKEDDMIYTIGDKINVIDANLNLSHTFNLQAKDIVFFNGNLYVLTENNDILLMTSELKFIKNFKLEEKFQFSTLSKFNGNLVVGLENGILLVDSIVKKNKEFLNLKSAPCAFVYNSSFLFYASNNENGLRILLRNKELYRRFPYKKIKIPPITTLNYYKDTLCIVCNRNILLLELTKGK